MLTLIIEGYSREDIGYKRIIFYDGSYYIGEMKDDEYHGHGKMVNSDGRV